MTRFKALTPAFRKRKNTRDYDFAPSSVVPSLTPALVPPLVITIVARASAPSVGTSQSAPPSTSSLYRLTDEDEEELATGEEDLMPCKMRPMDTNDGVTHAVDEEGGDFSLREMVTIIIGDEGN